MGSDLVGRGPCHIAGYDPTSCRSSLCKKNNHPAMYQTEGGGSSVCIENVFLLPFQLFFSVGRGRGLRFFSEKAFRIMNIGGRGCLETNDMLKTVNEFFYFFFIFFLLNYTHSHEMIFRISSLQL